MLHGLLEVFIEHLVGLIDDEAGKPVAAEALGVLQVIQQAAGGRHYHGRT